MFLGPMANLDPKGEGDGSMPENRRSSPSGRIVAQGGPHDMAKSGLTEPKSPGWNRTHAGNRLKPAPHPCSDIEGLSGHPPGLGRCPARAFKEMSWAPKSCCYVWHGRTWDHLTGANPRVTEALK